MHTVEQADAPSCHVHDTRVVLYLTQAGNMKLGQWTKHKVITMSTYMPTNASKRGVDCE
ncbi:hypothetical protein PAXRUDRAFT_829281 [Paxillus rubicundulus Ve08.2h10]|uniref:Uncharacterized protein n=1 Tax=Paxillus rubicundulus Ve08.2h10 TaxID=930991 RepID=A0A0D0E0A1_9AGAM|nr:hypothetical protein PAXRUDRAFT_829281 [Paxillus rubicundulus Ve08.2h10]